jgi:hypothetical protein
LWTVALSPRIGVLRTFGKELAGKQVLDPIILSSLRSRTYEVGAGSSLTARGLCEVGSVRQCPRWLVTEG